MGACSAAMKRRGIFLGRMPEPVSWLLTSRVKPTTLASTQIVPLVVYLQALLIKLYSTYSPHTRNMSTTRNG